MADKKQKSEPEFIRGTVLASILLLLIFIAAGVVFARNPDAVRGAAAVNSLGQLVSSNKSITAENAQLLLELPIGTGCHASLYADGRLVSGVLGDEVWEDIVQADISPRALLAVDGDGNIRSRFFRESDSVEFPVSGRAVLCGAGTEHYVFVLEDGSLAAFGDNSYGQCDVQKLAAKAAKD